MLASACRFRWLAALCAGWAVCAAVPALAASVKDVRVGVHPKFTRLVFELDSSAGYKVERVGTDAAPELRITIEAAGAARDLRAAGDIRGVKMEAGAKARAHIALRQSDVRVREMILSDPPRIVIDLVKSETALAAADKPEAKPAAKPEPKQIAKSEVKESAKPKPEVKAAAKPAPKESAKPVAKEIAPKETAKVEIKEPVKEPAKEIAKESPAPKPPVPVQPAPAPTQTAAAPTTPAPAPKLSPEPPAPAPTAALTPAPRMSPEPSLAVNPPAPSPAPAIVPPPVIPPMPSISPTPDSDAKLAPPVLPTEPPTIAPPPEPVRPMASPIPAPSIAPEPPSKPAASWSERLTSDPIWIGAIAAALLGLAAIALVMRRRRALPNDLDVTAIAEEVEQSSETPGRIPSGGFAMGDDSESREARADTTFSGLFDRPEDRPAPSWSAPAPESAPMAAPAPAAPMAAAAEDSLFDSAGDAPAEPDSRQGDDAMDTDMDLPMDRRANPPAARMGGAAAPAASPDLMRMFQDMERRIATLEARLDESNEAREKLERQVAAQSEELRVQRAAIARTQRALRTMTRGDEDKATEPALRDGDTQAKTRVTP